jgi:hypothetical protein
MRYLLEITITKENVEEIGVPTYFKVEGKSLVELLSKLPLIIANHVKKTEDELRITLRDDDIPF